MHQPSVSVVIRCFNEERHIGRLLQGLAHQSRAHDVVVVDSGSTDASARIARDFGARVVPIRPEDFSFGRALNVGCEAARGDVLVFASAHVYPVYTDWLESMASPFADEERVGAVYGKQRGCETTRWSEHQIFAHWFPDDGPAEQEHPFCNNANCAVPRQLWEQVPYEEELTGLEDLAWAKTVAERGYRIVYEPDAEIVHVHDEAPTQIYRRYLREAIALKRIYPDQTMSVSEFARIFVGNTAADYAHALFDGALREPRHLWEIPTFRFLQFLGAYRGLRSNGTVSDQLRRRFYYPRGLPAGRTSGATPARCQRIVYS